MYAFHKATAEGEIDIAAIAHGEFDDNFLAFLAKNGRSIARPRTVHDQPVAAHFDCKTNAQHAFAAMWPPRGYATFPVATVRVYGASNRNAISRLSERP